MIIYFTILIFDNFQLGATKTTAKFLSQLESERFYKASCFAVNFITV